MEIKVVRQILEWNENCHEELQKLFDEKKILVINIMGSPGAGKTTFIKKLIEEIMHECKVGVIEGDVAGKIDAEKIAESGVPVVQLNTDGACHIEGMSIKNILCEFDLDNLDVLIVENIGNLVCPAEFDIGEDLKVAILGVTEGDDKVEKYPLMFSRADALILSKYDMKDAFHFNEKRVFDNAKNINKDIKIFKVNSVSGQGVKSFASWIKDSIKR